jgi:hypothetical protein
VFQQDLPENGLICRDQVEIAGMKGAVRQNDDRRAADKPSPVTAAGLTILKADLAKQLHGLNITRRQRHSAILAWGRTDAGTDKKSRIHRHFIIT